MRAAPQLYTAPLSLTTSTCSLLHASALCAKSCSAAKALSGGLMPLSQDLSASQLYSSAAYMAGNGHKVGVEIR